MLTFVSPKILIAITLLVTLSAATSLYAFPQNAQPATTQPATTQPTSTQPAGPAILAVRAIQSTPGGPAITTGDVTLELFHRNQVVKKYEAKLDEHGVVMFEDLPAAMGFHPIVTVIHAGVPYTVTGQLMDAANPKQSLEVKVYETTEQQPNWTIEMRRVVVSPAPEGLRFTETVIVNNPADRTWVVPHEPVEGKPEHAVYFMLPTAMIKPQIIKGFDECCTRLSRDGKLANLKPLRPGQTEYRFAYTLPIHEDHVHSLFNISSATNRFVLMVPAKTYQLEVPDVLVDQGEITMHNHNAQYYIAQNLAVGDKLEVMFNGVTTQPQAQPANTQLQAPPDESTPVSKIIVGIIAATILLVAGLLTIIRKPQAEQENT